MRGPARGQCDCCGENADVVSLCETCAHRIFSVKREKETRPEQPKVDLNSPAYVLRPKLCLDSRRSTNTQGQFLAVFGEFIGGRGNTPAEAYEAFNRAWFGLQNENE